MNNQENGPKCTVIMYHYVRDMHETDYPGIKGLLIKKFLGQLDYIIANYKVISLAEYVDFLHGKTEIPDNSAILTFDDGLKDHYNTVFPILKERGLTATFFPITQAQTDQVVPGVLKAQFLLAKIGSNPFAKEFNYLLEKDFPKLFNQYKVTDKEKMEMKYRWDDPLTANLKFSIGTLPGEARTKILNKIFPKYFDNEKNFINDLCMNWDEMREMQEAGMSFGGHTHTHPRLAELDEEAQKQELVHCTDILTKNLNKRPTLFSYPYGDFNNITLKLLKELGYDGAISTNVAVNQGRVDPFNITRMDTNDIPFENSAK
ncbi:MAG: polysaccharide deacetylase family protein [Nanoarchaeota archaeon]|nr:polysaccharide deacetylase family protein [Nanoarchaeota archaeon]